MHNDPRLALITPWLYSLNLAPRSLEPASADASFRRYFRVTLHDGSTRIVMDAPPQHEDMRPFIHIAQRLLAHGVPVPKIHAADLTQGLMLLDDFGATHLLAALRTSPEAAPSLYPAALHALRALRTTNTQDLPRYDAERLTTEMRLFDTWYLRKHLHIEPSPADLALLEDVYARLTARALAQTQGFVHRDYHSRNLMLIDHTTLGILDFQDAVHGPITYDLASLLRDSYIAWPETQIEAWLQSEYQFLHDQGMIGTDWPTFKTDFDWMSAQRHLKVLGIFARLHHRDGKSGYLADLPLTLCNLHQSLAPYPEFAEFIDWLNQHGCARP